MVLFYNLAQEFFPCLFGSGTEAVILWHLSALLGGVQRADGASAANKLEMKSSCGKDNQPPKQFGLLLSYMHTNLTKSIHSFLGLFKTHFHENAINE